MITKLKINFDELEKKKERNKIERIKFIDMYTNWLKKTPNDVWSKHHSDFINSGFVASKKKE